MNKIEQIENALEFNTEVQADHLSMQNTRDELLRLVKEQKTLSTLISQVDQKFCNDYADQYLEYPGMESFNLLQDDEKADRLKAVLRTRFDNNSIRIGREVNSMLEGSVADLNKTVTYPRIHPVTDKEKRAEGYMANRPLFSYDYHAIENIATTLKEMLISITNLASQGLTYQELKQQFMEKNELNMLLSNMVISDEDYVTMNIPSPKIQYITISDEELNNIGPMINQITDRSVMDSVRDTKYNLVAMLSGNNPADAIKAAHLSAQIIMAIKNSVLLLREYHKVFINDVAGDTVI